MAGIPKTKVDDCNSDSRDGLQCFDRDMAQFETLVVPIRSVLDLLSVTHAPEVIQRYRDAMDSGAAFPPISVIRAGRRFIVADGHKRLSACKRRGMTHVMVQVWSWRKLAADLGRQFARSTARLASLLWRSIHDPGTRPWLRKFYWDTVLHWRRFLAALPASLGLAEQKAADCIARSEGTFFRLVRECARFRGHLVVITVSLAALGAAQLYLTWIAKLWADGPLRTGDPGALRTLATRASLSCIVLILGLFFSRYFLQSLNQHLVQVLRDRAQRRLLEVELASVRRFQVGELMSRMFNDAGALTQFVREILRRGIGETFVLAGSLTMIVRLDWRLAAIIALVGPPVYFLLSYCGGYVRRRSAEAQQEVGALSAVFTQQLAGLSTIKGFQTETAEQRVFERKDTLYRRHAMRSQFWLALMTTGVWALTFAALLAVVWYGTSQVALGRVTPGVLFAFCLYAVQTVEPVRRLGEVHGLTQQALAAASRVFEIIDLAPVEHDDGVALPDTIKGALYFEGVNFQYPSGRSVLRKLNFTVAPRETVAIVAASGGGKSTIAKLMLRFLAPTGGRILLDGIDIQDARLSQLRRAICVVEQDPFIFSGSLFDNLRYGSPDAEPERVNAAIALAGLDRFVAALPAGLDTQLAESGRNISGGQYQRIALARAIVRDPAVLVLDEATSAVDSETEQGIFEGIAPWLARRTVLIMTHRLSTVMRFPRVIVLSEGAIAGDGNPALLMRTCPVFQRLFAEQVAPMAEREAPVT